MKLKVTFIMSNDKPISNLGNNPIEKLEKGYKLVASILNAGDDYCEFDNVEILEEN